MKFGNPAVFAIESSITYAYDSVGQRALGFFVIYIKEQCYGVRSSDASLLACSLDAVRRRLDRRGLHCCSIGLDVSAIDFVHAICGAMYDQNRQREKFFGLSADEFRESVTFNELIWAPDGDEAFDDGSHVVHFDQGDKVRLIAFRNAVDQSVFDRSVVEAWLNADDFYAILDQWQLAFEAEWLARLRSN
jgi:hypothetical protein